MAKKKQFAKMVFYVEACESGSMFKDLLPKNINVFATTAANDHESSYACYWDDKRNTYLGDVYSVMWMEDSDVENLNKETLQKQFLIVKNETNTSHAMEFGDRTISKMMVSEFQGKKKSLANLYYPQVPLEPVASSEVPVAILRRKLSKVNSVHEEVTLRRELDTLLKHREYMRRDVEQIVRRSVFNDNQVKTVFGDKQDLRNHDCYQDVTSYFSKHCYPLSKNAYALRYMYVFVNLCEYGVTDAVMKSAMDKVCDRPIMVGVN
jgi:legumain